MEGFLPFQYLGVPVTAGRLSKKEASVLIEKIVERIRNFGSRKLSYAGRLVLVNSVLTSLYTYWAQIFLIPKGVIRRVDAICRNYLWDGSTEFLRAPRVAWNNACAPKNEGGLGVRCSETWNVAAIGKLVWWIYVMPDNLWVRWINHVYLKGKNWSDYTPKGDISWHWKVICRVKDRFVQDVGSDFWRCQHYSVCSGYEALRVREPGVV
ncbi:hypothetical protein RND81_01G149900 [Saponaria officinalis]|uniref:Uncharacterized protein n=1 Tax=Saponaria officinalis TaxID=3572 RepID=A0AAW1NA11_SAPOF